MTDLLVSLHNSFRPVAVTLGIVAMYLCVVILLTTWAKRRLGTTWWRRFHLASVPAFTFAMAHGIWTGTDSVQPWLWWTYMVTGAIVLFLVIVRGLTAKDRPEKRVPPERPLAAVPTTDPIDPAEQPSVTVAT